MRLQLVLELLLVFLLLAFAAWGRVIDTKGSKAAISHRKGGKVNTKIRQNTANKYCSCSTTICNCCRDFALPVVELKGPGCASLQYLKGDRLAISMSFGDRVLTNTTVEGRSPRPVCMPLPGGISKFCGRVYNIARKGEDFNACLGLELRALKDVEASLRVSCFKFGPQGLKVEPAQPLPPIKGGGDDEDDDDDDDIEDEFDFDDEEDDDDAEEDDNDVDAVDYEGFSVFGDDFLDGLFETSSGNKKKPVNKKTVQSTTAKAPVRRVSQKPVNVPPKRANIPAKPATKAPPRVTKISSAKATTKITRATTPTTTTTPKIITTSTTTTTPLPTTFFPSTSRPSTSRITTASSTTPFTATSAHPVPPRYTIQYSTRPLSHIRPDLSLNVVNSDLQAPSIPSSPQDSIAALAAMLQDSPGVIPQAPPVQVEPVQTHGAIVPATIFVTSAPPTYPTTLDIMTEPPLAITSQETTIQEDSTEAATENAYKSETTTTVEKFENTETPSNNIEEDEDDKTEGPVESLIVRNDDDDDDNEEEDESSTSATAPEDEKESKGVLGDLVDTVMETFTGEDSDSSEATTLAIASGGSKDEDDDDADEDDEEADDDEADDDDDNDHEENEDEKDDDDEEDDDEDDEEARKARRKSRSHRQSKDMWLARLHW